MTATSPRRMVEPGMSRDDPALFLLLLELVLLDPSASEVEDSVSPTQLSEP